MRLLEASLLIALYTVHSGRLFREQFDYNLLFRWFLEMDAAAPSFDHSSFSRNRARLLEHDVAREFFTFTKCCIGVAQAISAIWQELTPTFIRPNKANRRTLALEGKQTLPQLRNFARIELAVSPNESEREHSPEPSTAGLPPHAPATAPPSKFRSALMRASTWARGLESMFVRRLAVVGVLGILVMIGLFLSNYSSDKARFYWSAMFPVFGVACLAHELAAGRAYELALWRIFMRQALHWVGPIVAVKILFMQHARGQMANDAVALTIILLLAVTCFLAGVHFDSSFYWVSAFLALAAVIGTEIETYLWFAVVLLLIAIAVVLVSAVLLRRGPKVGPPPADSATA